MRRTLPPDIIKRYEGLRHDFLKGEDCRARQWRGMAQQGLLAWAQVEPTHRFQVLPPCSLDGQGVPAELHSPVTHVLASMVLRLHPEVSHGS